MPIIKFSKGSVAMRPLWNTMMELLYSIILLLLLLLLLIPFLWKISIPGSSDLLLWVR